MDCKTLRQGLFGNNDRLTVHITIERASRLLSASDHSFPSTTNMMISKKTEVFLTHLVLELAVID